MYVYFSFKVENRSPHFKFGLSAIFGGRSLIVDMFVKDTKENVGLSWSTTKKHNDI
jgi:hypothetical protein